MMHCSKETLLRSIVLLIALFNQVLTALGKNPLPFSEASLYEGLSAVATVAASLWAWWKNNSFTKDAVESDRYFAALRAIRQGEEEEQ